MPVTLRRWYYSGMEKEGKFERFSLYLSCILSIVMYFKLLINIYDKKEIIV